MYLVFESQQYFYDFVFRSTCSRPTRPRPLRVSQFLQKEPSVIGQALHTRDLLTKSVLISRVRSATLSQTFNRWAQSWPQQLQPSSWFTWKMFPDRWLVNHLKSVDSSFIHSRDPNNGLVHHLNNGSKSDPNGGHIFFLFYSGDLKSDILKSGLFEGQISNGLVVKWASPSSKFWMVSLVHRHVHAVQSFKLGTILIPVFWRSDFECSVYKFIDWPFKILTKKFSSGKVVLLQTFLKVNARWHPKYDISDTWNGIQPFETRRKKILVFEW